MKIDTSTLLLLAGAGVILLAASKQKRRAAPRKGAADEPARAPESAPEPDEDLDAEDQHRPAPAPAPSPSPEPAVANILADNMDPGGRAQLGMLYQIRAGDTPLEVCREALFGSREPVADPAKRRAVIELLVRIYCSPWNQALYAVPLAKLKDYPVEVEEYWTKRGLSFDPVYQDNRQRIEHGLQPTAEGGFRFALIWIPMIDVDRLDMEGVVTTEGMYYPDAESGMGGSMIDPPSEIVDIGFEQVSGNEVGCNMPEGDFRRTLVAS